MIQRQHAVACTRVDDYELLYRAEVLTVHD
jgi:hypothetical protein